MSLIELRIVDWGLRIGGDMEELRNVECGLRIGEAMDAQPPGGV